MLRDGMGFRASVLRQLMGNTQEQFPQVIAQRCEAPHSQARLLAGNLVCIELTKLNHHINFNRNVEW